MGASNGGIAIKTDTSQIDLSKVVKDIFGHDFEKTDIRCDSRKSDCVGIAKTKDFLYIFNAGLADIFFERPTTEKIQRYLDYFSHPSFVFAFEEYDSGGTYSYSLIYNGVVKRQFRSESYEITTDFGELEPVEMKWKNAEIIREELDDGEVEIIYKDPVSGLTCTEMSLPYMILQELFKEKLGATTWDLYQFVIEDGRFKKNPASGAVQSNEQEKKKAWWKF